MIQQLLPCPFCGGSASIEQYGDARQSTIYRCDNCSCSLETGEEWGHGRLWNKRAALASHTSALAERDARIAELEAALKPFGEAWGAIISNDFSVRNLSLGQLGALASYEVSGVHFQKARAALAKEQADA